MATKKMTKARPIPTPAPTAEPTPAAVVSHCTFTNSSAANEHTRAAVVALADAIKSNADAIIATANALRGSPATMGTGLHIEG
jgi:hypothetical protein